MTEQQETTEPVVQPELPVTLKGREMFVRMPKPEQLLVWQRTVGMLTTMQTGTSWTGSEVMAALERCRKIIDSILVNKADVIWIDDQFLEGTLEFRDLMPFITHVVEKFAEASVNEAPNREAKRAVKKAVRKKVTS